MSAWRHVVVLSGGVGGARFARGLAAVLPADALTVVVNTGDDFVWWGLAISPDLDTVMYTLAGLAHEERGWGLDGETFQALAMVERYGGPAWFQLGDRDLATHLVRTEALARGETLTAVTAHLCDRLGVRPRVLPMADAPRRTRIDTVEHGTLLFQEWFVRERARPAVARVWFDGSDTPAPGLTSTLASAELVLIGPSNPYVSIDPILSLTGVRAALANTPVVAVSPIVGGRAVKGPLGEMIPQLTGARASAAAVCAHYAHRWDGLLAGFVVERGDEGEIANVADVPVLATDTIMSDRAASERLAREVLAFGERLRSGR
jgi:LPPG:FO 2-phospho-L-lactate transferase